MTLGKHHLLGMVPLLAAAVAYNIWYFAVGEDSTDGRPAAAGSVPTAAAGPSVAGEPTAAVDPMAIPPVADVALDKLPQWRRNPFVSVRSAAVPAVEAPAAETTLQAEADIVVDAIFTPADRPARARVNGEIVRVGDRIGTATVVEIQARAIVVDTPKGRRTVTAERRAVPSPRGVR